MAGVFPSPRYITVDQRPRSLSLGARLRSAAALNATDRRDFAGAIAGRGRCGCLIQDLGINRLQRRGDDAAGETVDAVLDVGQAHVAGGAASEFAVSGQQGRAKAVRVLFTVFDEHDGSPLPGLGRRPEPCCTPCAAVGSMIC